MQLTREIPERNRPFRAAAGAVKSILAIVLVWIGMNSLLVGFAYGSVPGSWAAKLTGGAGLIIGTGWFWKGFTQLSRSLFPPKTRRNRDLMWLGD